MRIGISNIAWDTRDDSAVASLLRAHQVDAIDIAPGKYFPAPEQATDSDIRKIGNWWRAQGMEITGMQALLFGTTGLNLFAEQRAQQAMLARLGAICRIAGVLQSPRLVFGSPRNRDRGELDSRTAAEIACTFFAQLGDIAAAEGVIVCLEPNPAQYGCNFMTTAEETADIVRAIAHPSIRMQLDTGAMHINNEDVDQFLAEHAALIGHIHASEPGLVPLGDGGVPHEKMAQALAVAIPSALVTIEMLETRDEPALTAITRALTVANQSYRSCR